MPNEVMKRTSQTCIVHAGLLWDGTGTPPRPGMSVVIEGGVIRSVEHTEAVVSRASEGSRIEDLRPYFIGPGLIDVHTHLSLPADGRPYAAVFSETDEMMALTGVMNMRRHLRAGVTTIREHGARNRVGFALKEALARGYVIGPRMLVSGRPITPTGGHFHFCNELADSEEAVRRSVARLVEEGADYIKIMASGGGTEGTNPGEASYETRHLRATVHEAHHFHRLTAAHCRAAESMRRAVEAGVDLIEHAEFMDPDRRLRFDPAIAEMMAEARVWISPTLQTFTEYPRIVSLRRLRARAAASPDDERDLERLEARADMRLDLVRRMLDYGMGSRIVPGTDSGVAATAFGHLDYDVQLLVQTGFTPEEALSAATRIAAEAVGAADYLGTIEPAKMADLVAFDGDPTLDAAAVSRVEAVFMEGARVG